MLNAINGMKKVSILWLEVVGSIQNPRLLRILSNRLTLANVANSLIQLRSRTASVIGTQPTRHQSSGLVETWTTG